MSFTLIDTIHGISHPEKCLEVQRRSDKSHYQMLSETEETPEAVCPLCEHSVTENPERYADIAIQVVERYFEEESDAKRSACLNALRHLITRSDEALQESEYLAEHVGASVKKVGSWRKRRSDIENQASFDRLLLDSMETSLAFDIAFYGGGAYDSWDDLLEAAVDGEFGMRCEKNTAKTIRWITEKHEPTIKQTVNSLLATNENSNVRDSAEEPQTTEADNGPSASSENTSEPAATTLGDF